uniref:Protein MAK11 n=1 Tax=Lygus hesperus TaxID=30085 RepID=A0A0A9WCF0_LYGHE
MLHHDSNDKKVSHSTDSNTRNVIDVSTDKGANAAPICDVTSHNLSCSQHSNNNDEESRKAHIDLETPASLPPTKLTTTKTANTYTNAFLMIGTYHSVCAGLVFKKNKFFITFSVKHHVGCINDVAMCDKYMVSCGGDERVLLYTNKSASSAHGNALSSKQRHTLRAAGEILPLKLAHLGSLTPPSEVRCVCFARSRLSSSTSSSLYLLCGCEDGQLLCYRTRD